MKNTFGNAVKVTLFGESHGDAIGAVIDGLTPGIKIDYEFIDTQLNRRRSKTQVCTKRVEKDDYRIVSGVFEGHTTGTCRIHIIGAIAFHIVRKKCKI